MTAPFLTRAQILNRLTLTARWVLRDHQPGSDGRCPHCRTPDCAVATVARDILTILKMPRWSRPVDRAPDAPPDP